MHTQTPDTARFNRRIVPTLVALSRDQDVTRGEIEAFIHAHFAQVHGADVRSFLPGLMSLRSVDGCLLGALGLRAASRHRLFLENYFDQPIEQALAAVIRAPVDRAGLVEVGNLAVGAPGGGRWLITALTAFMHAVDMDWAVFTCGPRLRNAFIRLGIELHDLGPAAAERLPADEVGRWGDYYAQGPRVMAARVTQGYAALAGRFTPECALTPLWQGADEVGRRAVAEARAA